MAEVAMIASAGLTAAGAGVSMMGSRMQGRAAKANAIFEASELRRKAVDVQAQSDRASQDILRQGDRVQSAFTANAAASGFDPTEGTNLDTVLNIERQTKLASGTETAMGGNKAADLIQRGGTVLAEGINKAHSASINQLSTGIEAANSILKGFMERSGGKSKGGSKDEARVPLSFSDYKAQSGYSEPVKADPWRDYANSSNGGRYG